MRIEAKKGNNEASTSDKICYFPCELNLEVTQQIDFIGAEQKIDFLTNKHQLYALIGKVNPNRATMRLINHEFESSFIKQTLYNIIVKIRG